MKFLIAGLGNIGAEYAHTRHNIGFDILDRMIAEKEIAFVSGRYAETVAMRIKNKTCLLIKPTTYMNLSGKAIKYWMDKENIPATQVIVVTDDINLPVGTLRIRKKGSDGGHNGIRNINEVLGTDQYIRVRFGAGGDFPKGDQVQFVLGKWDRDEQQLVQDTIVKAVEAIRTCVLEGPEKAMNNFN